MSAPERIALVGLPGSGKSSVATELARRLGWNCVDTDEQVAQRAGRSVAEIFVAEGEPAFRRYERRALLHALAQAQPTIIACGGGLIADEANRRALLEDARVVLLDAPDDVLLGRLRNGSVRPLLGDDPATALARLRADRREAYETAQVRVVSVGSVNQVAETVMQSLEVDAPALPRRWEVDAGPGVLRSIAGHLPESTTRVALVADRAVADAADA
ncbi:MAG: shikimate kinase, partial [Candidatus Dormibacteraeota bacterium]|nr:shikimate kinase [Candidatus Dormibacteraeota bacterium]